MPDIVINSAVKYSYVINGEIKETITNTKYTFENLDLDTLYKISIIAIDEDDKTKVSKQKEERTLNKLYLYKSGNECVPVTGGWSSGYTGGNDSNVGRVTKNNDNINISTWGTWCEYSIWSSKNINRKEFSNLFLEVKNASITGVSSPGYEQWWLTVGEYNNGGLFSVIKDINKLDISNINNE